jgi:hypothetical protein
LATAAFLPVAWGFYGPLVIAWGIYVATVRIGRTYLSFGRPNALGIEEIATLVAIPLSGLVGSVGASLAFYELSESTAKAWQDGWDTLANTIALALAIIFSFVWLLARHQSGADPLPFERNVDPQLGIRATRELRTRRPKSFLPGQNLFAAVRTNETIRSGRDNDQPSLREAIASVLEQSRDRTQLLAVSLAAPDGLLPW